MDFIKTMRKREYIEMGIKTGIAVLAALIAIILMEGMIYGINLHALETKGTSYTTQSSTVVYAIKKGDDKYFLLFYNEDQPTEWQASKISSDNDYKTKAEVELMSGSVAKIVWHAPNAFKFSFNASHWFVIILFVGAVGGYFAYRFLRLKSEYVKIEDEFKRTGTIEITNL